MIEELGKNKARLRVSIGSGKARKVYTKTVTYNGKKDLQRQYNAFEMECAKTPYTNATLEDIVNLYIENRIAIGSAPTTVRNYRIALNRLSADIRHKKASNVSPLHFEKFIAESKDKYSPKTIKNTISLVSASYRYAIRHDLLTSNPCDKVELPKQTQAEINTLSAEEIVDLLARLEYERLDFKVGYLLCLFCGMRRSEVLGLRECDVDFERKLVRIHSTRHNLDGKESIQDTKTEKSKRNLAVPDFILDDIRSLIELHHGYEWETSDYLILTAWGEKMHPATFTAHLKRNIMPQITVHGLRHTFATMLNAEGIDIARISAELGHSNIATTLNKYTHVFGGATASSRGIADAMNDKYGK